MIASHAGGGVVAEPDRDHVRRPVGAQRRQRRQVAVGHEGQHRGVGRVERHGIRVFRAGATRTKHSDATKPSDGGGRGQVAGRMVMLPLSVRAVIVRVLASSVGTVTSSRTVVGGRLDAVRRAVVRHDDRDPPVVGRRHDGGRRGGELERQAAVVGVGGDGRRRAGAHAVIRPLSDADVHVARQVGEVDAIRCRCRRSTGPRRAGRRRRSRRRCGRRPRGREAPRSRSRRGTSRSRSSGTCCAAATCRRRRGGTRRSCAARR